MMHFGVVIKKQACTPGWKNKFSLFPCTQPGCSVVSSVVKNFRVSLALLLFPWSERDPKVFHHARYKRARER